MTYVKPITGDVLDKAYFDACFLEYKAIRDEIVAVYTRLYMTLQYGTTICLGFMVAGFSFWKKEHLLVALDFGILVPTLAFWFIQMLLGHIALIWRNGTYCRLLEEKFHLLIGLPFVKNHLESTNQTVFRGAKVDNTYPISWETWLEGKASNQDRHTGHLARLAIGLIVILSVTSLTIYSVYVWNYWPKPETGFSSVWMMVYHRRNLTVLLLIPILLKFATSCYWLIQAKDSVAPLGIFQTGKSHTQVPATIEQGEPTDHKEIAENLSTSQSQDAPQNDEVATKI